MKLIHSDLLHKVRELATKYELDKNDLMSEFILYADRRMRRDDYRRLNKGVEYHVLDSLASRHYEESFKIFERYIKREYK